MVTKESKISDIIRENPERVLTLDKYGVKFYQNPGITLMEACTGKKIDLNHLINDLERLEKGASILINWENWSLYFKILFRRFQCIRLFISGIMLILKIRIS